MKVYITGTKKEIDVEGALKEKLDQLMAQETDILIGDSMGVDKCVQEYLAAVEYKAVTVYSSGDEVQNNVGKWPEEHVKIELYRCEFYSAKNSEMPKKADYGMILWDGESKGSFVNILKFLAVNKKCELFLLKDKMWITVHTEEDLKPYMGTPGKLKEVNTREIFRECGFSEEMLDYLEFNYPTVRNYMNGVIRCAPISLVKKLTLLRKLSEKENVFFELFDSFRKWVKGRDDYGEGVFINPLQYSFGHSHRDILDAQKRFYNKEPDSLFYLFEGTREQDAEWRERPRGVFRFSEQVVKYISDKEFYRLELWERNYTGGEHYEHLYNYYFYKGEICWFEKMKPYFFGDDKIYYWPVNWRYRDEVGRGCEEFWANPFFTGDILKIDYRPFEAPFYALVLYKNEILFRSPYTNKWDIKDLYWDSAAGPIRLSPLYRIKSVSEQELSDKDDFLIKVKNALGLDGEKAAMFENAWKSHGKSKEQIEEILRDVSKI